MNLKKLSYLPISFLVFINGCVSLPKKNVDQPLVEDIWTEVKKVTDIEQNQPLPNINYIEDCYEFINPSCYAKELCNPEEEQKRMSELRETNKLEWKKCRKKERSDVLGIYYFHCETISICLNNMMNYLWDWKYANVMSLTLKEKEAVFYNTVAHELLHHALYLKGIWPSGQHRIMQDEKYLENIIDMISRHFNLPLDGLQKENSMASLKQGVQLDEEKNIKTIKRESPLSRDEFYIKCN